MGWFGKLTFGSMGLIFGGPLGAIAGAALGHHLIDRRDSAPHQWSGTPKRFNQVEQSQASYFICIFSILGKLAKADGVVSKAEISVVEEFISHMNMPEREAQFAKQIFNQAKRSPYSIDDFVRQFFQLNRRRPTVLISFLDVLFRLAASDGELHHAEDATLLRIKEIFQISDVQYNNIKAVYFKDVNQYYQILNVTPENTDHDIKANYKKLVKEFHPDTVISKGLPPEFVQFATERFQQIQDAYEKIKKERQL